MIEPESNTGYVAENGLHRGERDLVRPSSNTIHTNTRAAKSLPCVFHRQKQKLVRLNKPLLLLFHYSILCKSSCSWYVYQVNNFALMYAYVSVIFLNCLTYSLSSWVPLHFQKNEFLRTIVRYKVKAIRIAVLGVSKQFDLWEFF